MIKYILALVMVILVGLSIYSYTQQEASNNLIIRKKSLKEDDLPIKRAVSTINKTKITLPTISDEKMKKNEKMIISEFLDIEENSIDYEVKDITMLDDKYQQIKGIENNLTISDEELIKNEKLIMKSFRDMKEEQDIDYEIKDITRIVEDSATNKIMPNDDIDDSQKVIESEEQMMKNEKLIIKEFLDFNKEIDINYETEDIF